MTAEALVAQMLADLCGAGCLLLLFSSPLPSRQQNVTTSLPGNPFVAVFLATFALALSTSFATMLLPGLETAFARGALMAGVPAAVVVAIWCARPRHDPVRERREHSRLPGLQTVLAQRDEAAARIAMLERAIDSEVSARTSGLTAANRALERELTGCRIAERRAAEDRRPLDELLMRTNTATAALDSDLRVLDGNEALARLLGQASIGQILGGELWRLLGLEDQTTLRHFQGETLALGTFSCDLEAMPPARGSIRVEAHGVASIVDGRPGIMALLRDVSGRAAAERDLKQSCKTLAAELDVARQANATNPLFLGKMHQELRTRLNGIIGLSEMLRHMASARIVPGSDIRKLSNGIHESGTSLLGLVDDLLDLSRLNAGTWILHPARVELRAEIDAALATLGPLAGRKRIRVENTCPSELRWVLDQRALRQVVINLVNNAVKFSPPGARVLVAVTGNADAVALHVTDEGPGLSAEDRQRISRPFGRGRYAEENRVHGFGLGLSIVAELLRLHGGTIGIDSELGRGSTFTAIFPRDPCQPAPMLVAAEQGTRPPPRRSPVGRRSVRFQAPIEWLSRKRSLSARLR